MGGGNFDLLGVVGCGVVSDDVDFRDGVLAGRGGSIGGIGESLSSNPSVLW